MPISTLKSSNVEAKIWAKLEDVEPQALDQIRNTSSLPWVRHVSIMADCHYGVGATVGSVVAMKGAVAPASVGVDIGCGVGAVKTNLTMREVNHADKLKRLKKLIEEEIPVGFNSHKIPIHSLFTRWRNIKDLPISVATPERIDRARRQLGTLGGGNHFLELSYDESGAVWMMVHSGSRNIGKELAEYHIKIAKGLPHNQDLVDKNLSVFLEGTPEFKQYWHDLGWAQAYAFENRYRMLDLFEQCLSVVFPEIETNLAVHCHHNYVAIETHFGEGLFVTRKGAINADKGKWGIIPGSMGTNSYIVRGLGNEDSLRSASHGAGRRMSRGQAKRTFTEEDIDKQLKSVVCRRDKGILDELPGAYKDIESVMENQKDLVQPVHCLKQLMCIKG
jgi:tRNA-splicing ligase RtcB